MTGQVFGALLILGLCIQLAPAANILAIFAHSSASPYLFVGPYVKALVLKGHQVTVVTAGKYFADINGARHIRVKCLDWLLDDFKEANRHLDFPLNKWEEAIFLADYFQQTSSCVLNDPGVQSLLHDKTAQYDMVILDASFTDALYGFGQHFNAPLVGLSVVGTAWNINYMAGNRAPSIYEPISSSGFSNGFSLLDKLRNWIYITEEWLLDQAVYLPSQVALYKRFFNETAESLSSMRRRFALVLINQHFSLGRARSNVPNVIEVAGMHLEQQFEHLDEELRSFVDEAEHGVIFFSMGTEITGSWMPPNLIPIMEAVFARLPQRIVIKFNQALAHQSDNINVREVQPQRALLAHPNVKLFITHSSIMSTIEGVYYGVPMLCLPLYGDQFGNSHLMRQAGVAEVLDVVTMTADSVLEAIKKLLKEPHYARKAKQMSIRLRDQPRSPLEKAVWWTEYVLRHQGAPHMRISEEDVSFIQYYNLDFISVLFLRFGAAILIIAGVGFRLVSFLLQRSNFRLTVPMLS